MNQRKKHKKRRLVVMTLQYRYVVYLNHDNRVYVSKGDDQWNELRIALKKQRYRSDLMVWRPFLHQWKIVPNIPFHFDVRLPKGFLLMLGPSFRNPLDLGHELSIYIQTLEWIDLQKKKIALLVKNRRRVFWKSQHLMLLMPPPICLSAPFRDGWFSNNNQHCYLSSYSLELMHMQLHPQWEWVKSWLKSQFDFPVCCTQKKLPEVSNFTSSLIIQNLHPVQNIKRLSRLAKKHLHWQNKTHTKEIEHLYLHNGCGIPIPSHIQAINIQQLPPYDLFSMLQNTKHIYRSHLLPCTEFLIIGLSISGAKIFLPDSFIDLDPHFPKC